MANKETDQATPHSRKALGRGLGALLESRTAPHIASSPAGVASSPEHLAAGRPGPAALAQIPLADIEPNPEQPRRTFSQRGLDELAASIRQHGVLQPVVVSTTAEGRYRLVAGERRWRAAHLAGLATIPAIIKEARADRALELALIENIQREDLNPMEAAAAFDRLAREFGLVHEEIARRTGKDRATITNILRLLRLPGEVQKLVAEGALSVGHAKALLSFSSPAEQSRIAAAAVARGLTVRFVEELAAQSDKPKREKKEKKVDANIRAALEDLERVLGTRVRLQGGATKGRLVIEYYSAADLMRLYDIILK